MTHLKLFLIHLARKLPIMLTSLQCLGLWPLAQTQRLCPTCTCTWPQKPSFPVQGVFIHSRVFWFALSLSHIFSTNFGIYVIICFTHCFACLFCHRYFWKRKRSLIALFKLDLDLILLSNVSYHPQNWMDEWINKSINKRINVWINKHMNK